MPETLRVPSRDQARARRTTNGRTYMSVTKNHSTPRETVNIRGFEIGAAHKPKIVLASIIHKYEQHIRTIFRMQSGGT